MAKEILNEKKTQSAEEEAWHALPTEKVLKSLQVHEDGLTAEEAARRQAEYGLNQLLEASRPGFLPMLWDQLNNFVVILLIVASVISALLGDYVEAAAIMAIVVLNAVLGIVQERRWVALILGLRRTSTDHSPRRSLKSRTRPSCKCACRTICS